MNDVIKRFTLELQKTGSNEVVYAKGGDTGRKIVVSLTDGGRPYQISSDCYAVFTGKKSSGKILNDCTVENNAVVYTITPQNVAAAEKIPCEIRLYNKDNKVITSARFTMIVEQPVNDGNDLTPSEEVEALTKLIGESLNAIDNANGAAEELRTARDNGEFDGPKGDPGPEGPQGEPGPAGPAGPAGAGRLDVTRNGNKASHNAMEIYEHTEKGGQVFFGGMQLRYADGSIAIFRHDTTFSDLPYLFESIRIYENGNIDIFSGNLPYLDDDAAHHTSTWSSQKIAKELNAKAPIILRNSTPTKHTSGDYDGQLCVCIMGDEGSIPTAELYIYSGCRAFDDTSPLEHYWEKVGDDGGNVDLTDYVKKTDYAHPDKTDAGVVAVNRIYGISTINSQGLLCISPASESEIKTKNSAYKPIAPNNLDYAIKVGLTTNTQTLTDAEKAAACEWLGVNGVEMLVATITHNEDGEISCDVDASQIRLALNSPNKAVKIVVNQQINGKRLFEPSVSVDLDGNISLYFADCRYEYDEITQSGWYYHSTVLPNGDEVSY